MPVPHPLSSQPLVGGWFAQSTMVLPSTSGGYTSGIQGFPDKVPWRLEVTMPALPACRICLGEPEHTDAIFVAVTAVDLASLDTFARYYDGGVPGDGTVACKPSQGVPAGALVLICPSPYYQSDVAVFSLRELPCRHPVDLRVTSLSAPEKSHVIAERGGLVLYRTASTVAEVARHFLGQGNDVQSLIWLEQTILQLAKEETLGEEEDRAWERYQKLKALALQPGTESEGKAAMRAAIAIAQQLAGITPRRANERRADAAAPEDAREAEPLIHF